MEEAKKSLAASRPTAVNLTWALKKNNEYNPEEKKILS